MLSRTAAVHAGPSTQRQDIQANAHWHNAKPDGTAMSGAASDRHRSAVTALAKHAEKEMRQSLRKPGVFSIGGLTHEWADRLGAIRGELMAFQQAGLATAAPHRTLGQRAKSTVTSMAAHSARVPIALAAGLVAVGTGTTVAIGSPMLSMCCVCGSEQTGGGQTVKNSHFGGLTGIAKTSSYVKAAIAGERSLPRMLFRTLDTVPSIRLHSRHARMSTNEIAQSTINALDSVVARIAEHPGY